MDKNFYYIFIYTSWTFFFLREIEREREFRILQNKKSCKILF